MQSINEDIKNNSFKHFYLLYGEEAYLKKSYKKKLKEALLPEDDTMNFSYYEGKDINAGEIIDLAETMPFFAERRLIIIENSGFFKSANELADYLKEAAETVYFIFVETEVDKRSKMFKAVKECGRVVEMPLQNEKTLVKWVLGILKKEEKKITETAINLFLNKTGPDMENIQKELEKLICYTMDKDSVTEADVEEICTVRVTNKIFDMINAVADKKQKEALDLYYDLLALKEPPMRILFLIARQFNLLMQVKDLLRLNYAQNEIAKKAGLHNFVAGKYIAQSKRFKMSRLKEAVDDCVKAEEEVKTGKMNDKMSVELLIVKYSS